MNVAATRQSQNNKQQLPKVTRKINSNMDVFKPSIQGFGVGKVGVKSKGSAAHQSNDAPIMGKNLVKVQASPQEPPQSVGNGDLLKIPATSKPLVRRRSSEKSNKS